MTWMSPKVKCQIAGCSEPAKYGIYKTFPDRHKVWLHVCIKCEKWIGNQNMRRVVDMKKEQNVAT